MLKAIAVDVRSPDGVSPEDRRFGTRPRSIFVSDGFMATSCDPVFHDVMKYSNSAMKKMCSTIATRESSGMGT